MIIGPVAFDNYLELSIFAYAFRLSSSSHPSIHPFNHIQIHFHSMYPMSEIMPHSPHSSHSYNPC